MKVLRNIIGGLVGLAVVLFGIGFALPSDAHVERATTINASSSEVYDLISNFEAWEKWSPWAAIDPDAKMTITGSGLGQTMAWSSDNPQVGKGSQEIIELDPNRHLKTHLEFDGQGVAEATFDLVTEDDATRVVWSLDSHMSEDMPVYFKPINNYLGLLLDSLVGKDYETGLANLKQVAEG